MQLARPVSDEPKPDPLTGTGVIEDSRILIIRSHAALADWEEEWTRLWSACPQGTVFQHYAWAEAWIESLGGQGEMRVVVAQDGARPGRAVAILPLWAGEDGTLFLVGDPRSDYQDIVCAGDADEIDRLLPAMLRSVVDSCRGWTRIVFNELRGDSLLLGSLRRLAAAGELPFGSSEKESSPCPVVELSGREDVLEEILKKKSLRRHYNKMAKMPGFRYRRIESQDEAQLILDALFEQHVARWAIQGGRSLFAEQRNVDFYRKLVASPTFFPLVHFVVVEVEGRPVATHLGFLRNDTFTWYKPSFDPNFERSSPGEVMILCLFREFQRTGLGEFDFTRGQEPFKSRFATTVRSNYRVTLFASSFDKAVFSLKERLRNADEGGALDRQVAAVLYPAARFIRRIAKPGERGDRGPGQDAGDKAAPTTGQEVLVFRFEEQGELPPAPRGLAVDLGPVDLLELGKLSLQLPEYLTAARLRSAVGRRHRGDRLLVIRNSAGIPRHVSWLRSEEGSISIPELDKKLAVGGDEGVEVIFDGWTAADARADGLAAWAARYLADQVAGDGNRAWLYCSSEDRGCRSVAADAGFALYRTVWGS